MIPAFYPKRVRRETVQQSSEACEACVRAWPAWLSRWTPPCRSRRNPPLAAAPSGSPLKTMTAAITSLVWPLTQFYPKLFFSKLR